MLHRAYNAFQSSTGSTNEPEDGIGTEFADPYLEQCSVWGLDLAGYYDIPDLIRQWREHQQRRCACISVSFLYESCGAGATRALLPPWVTSQATSYGL